MEAVEKTELWNQCLDIIRDNVTTQQFETFFKFTDLGDYRNGKLVLNVASQFIKEGLEKNYLDLMSKTFKRVFGQPVELYYRILEIKETNTTVTVKADDVVPNNVAVAANTDARKVPTETAADKFDSQLRPSYSFANYYEGDSNRLARSVGESIAQNPAKTFNPFFVFGPSGCGKTHLINAIGLRTKQLHPNLKVLYVSAHLFMVQWTDAVRFNKRNDFIAFYQTIDMLIIDDIQELAGKTDTQNTFFHIFNHLHLNGKQLILSADRPPVAITGLEDRLLTRFKWGLQAEIEKPSKSLRLSILKGKVKDEQLQIPEDIINYITDNIDESVRDLEGIINSLMAYSVVYNCDINMQLVNKILPRFVAEVPEKPIVNVERIKKVVCDYFDISVETLCSKTRKQPISYIRQMAIYLSDQHTDESNVQIGLQMGGRNHATVIHAIKQIKNQIDVSEETRRNIAELEQKIALI